MKNYKNIYSVNPLYLILGELDGHIEENNEDKYLIFDSTDEKKKFKKCAELWDEIKNEIETINGGKKGVYGKDFTKIKYNTYDNLPLDKPLKLHMLTIVVRCIFQDGKFCLQLYLDDCLYEL